MNKLNDLQKVANRNLAGLNATDEMKYKILHTAREQSEPRSTRKWVLTVCAGVAAAAIIFAAVPKPLGQPASQEVLIHSLPAGSSTDAPHLIANNGISNASISSDAAPVYKSIWVSGGGSFPMICVNGRVYRELSTPSNASASIGNRIGSIDTFTDEPALALNNGTVSNICAAGNDIWEISGMGGTLVCCEVEGKKRLFQRTSFNGSAILGNERLADTLQIAGHITGIELSDVGTLTDAAKCSSVFSTLVNCASYESSACNTSSQSLTFHLDNGYSVQLMVRNDTVSGCGTWSCPEFFEAFRNALQ